MSKAPETELAWAAGFFDGEGSSSLNGLYARLTIGQIDTEVLKRFQTAVERGTINGPYGPFANNVQPLWRYSATGRDALEAMSLIYPFLSSVKREQWDRVISNPTRLEPHRRGFCRKDLHELTPENRFQATNEEYERCLACRRISYEATRTRKRERRLV